MTLANVVSDLKKGNGSAAIDELDLESRLGELRLEMDRITQNLADFGATKVDDYKAGIDKLVADAVSASLNAVQSAKSEAVSIERQFENQIKARPLQAIGIAVAVGFAAALLSRRA